MARYACPVSGECVLTRLSTSGESRIRHVAAAHLRVSGRCPGKLQPSSSSLDRPACGHSLPPRVSAPFLPQARCILDCAKVLGCLGHDAAQRTAAILSCSGLETCLLIREKVARGGLRLGRPVFHLIKCHLKRSFVVVNSIHVALVPLHGEYIRLTNPKAMQAELQSAMRHYLHISDVWQFGKEKKNRHSYSEEEESQQELRTSREPAWLVDAGTGFDKPSMKLQSGLRGASSCEEQEGNIDTMTGSDKPPSRLKFGVSGASAHVESAGDVDAMTGSEKPPGGLKSGVEGASIEKTPASKLNRLKQRRLSRALQPILA
ncbi:hypothetical protein HPB51_020114 [Rhipicephalus microplus]|uniref:Uncharacterized protein n=1 Tax=Rhipicephalus microplus TaxID=6941 RepID=A0A9J6EI09_RHIMP|nr:hypothetical protein HPB51_020114 [Rhipicephalus microplus]